MENAYNFGALIKMYRLFDDTYLAEFENCIAIVKVNDNGEIVNFSRFGNRKGEAS